MLCQAGQTSEAVSGGVRLVRQCQAGQTSEAVSGWSGYSKAVSGWSD